MLHALREPIVTVEQAEREHAGWSLYTGGEQSSQSSLDAEGCASVVHALSTSNFIERESRQRRWLIVAGYISLTNPQHNVSDELLESLSEFDFDNDWSIHKLKDDSVVIEHMQQSVEQTFPGHSALADYQLGSAFEQRHANTGDSEDLNSAIEQLQETVNLMPRDDSDRAGRLKGLRVFCITFKKKISSSSTLPQPMGGIFSNVDFRSFWVDRYRRLGNIRDLEAALQTSQEVVNLTPKESPDRGGRLQSLAMSFTDRYQRLGNPADLDSALRTNQEAVVLTPQDYPDRGGRLQSLAICFTYRYQRLGNVADLDSALQTSQEALDLTPKNHHDRPGRLHNHAISLMDRYQRLGDLMDWDAALQAKKEAVDMTPADDPNRAERLESLAISLSDRCRLFGDPEDLDVALKMCQEVVDTTPPGHRDKAGRLETLAMCLIHRYQRVRDLKDLESALERRKEALALTPKDHPARAVYLQSLAMSLGLRFRTLRQPEDLEAVYNLHDESFKTEVFSDPGPLWDGALAWALFCEEFDPIHSPIAYAAAFNLLPEILFMGHSIPVRQETIQWFNIGDTASAATQTCIKLSDLTSAIQIIEQGVATTFQQMLELKPDFDSLPPDQAEDLQKISLALYTGEDADPRRLAHKRTELLQNIRNQPGFEHFLRSKPYKALSQASQGGPIVILNSQQDGCDGIVILNPISDPVHVAFTHVTLDVLENQQAVLKDLLRRCNARAGGESTSTRLLANREGFSRRPVEECFTDLLSWLWNNIVNPVYQTLASYGIHGGRLWWLSTGLFSGLPLHASPPTNQFIHSYTATLGSLLEAQAERPSIPPFKFGMVGVTHTGPERNNYLKGVEEELNKTAMGDAELVNESFHLGGGFIAAGFRGAIGTLWSMDDQDGPMVAETVYSHLFRDGRQPQASDAAEALQLAVNKLKAQGVPYHRWVPFIHMGV
ncbi:hypothetical protein GGX14DRAFT_544315 [Mycena pura]|uniref:CHAT domain-containing protein n=1 Tax=Mycena pura TaxID=153505 RepID=A0AAD6V5S5_9AGAR|nr:hypothetical protein GGX14DRAFT_544315 [Mycena pura]